jgi:hypothetical protein
VCVITREGARARVRSGQAVAGFAVLQSTTSCYCASCDHTYTSHGNEPPVSVSVASRVRACVQVPTTRRQRCSADARGSPSVGVSPIITRRRRPAGRPAGAGRGGYYWYEPFTLATASCRSVKPNAGCGFSARVSVAAAPRPAVDSESEPESESEHTVSAAPTTPSRRRRRRRSMRKTR